jgi:predicted nucleic acid-binding protein
VISTLVDSNILIDIFTDNPDWSTWSLEQLTQLLNISKLCINPVIYAEVSMGFKEIESFNSILKTLPLYYEEIPMDALFLAGKVFLNYRKNEGKKTTTLPDFFIGAHASVMGWTVLTRDPKRMKYYFPKLKIICPEKI